MTIKQRKRRHARRRAHAAGVSRAIGRPAPSPCVVPRAVDTELRAIAADTIAVQAAAALYSEREVAFNALTVAKLQELATRCGVEYRAKDRKADLIAKIIAAETS